MGVFDELPDDYFEEVDLPEIESSIDDVLKNHPDYERRKSIITEYLKIGPFCGGMDLDKFESMTLLDRAIISDEIDNRLKPYIAEFTKKSRGSGSGTPLMPLDYNHLGLILALATMMSGED